MRKPRPLRALLWPVGALFLVGLVGTLQYRWLGEVSEADRARRQTLLQQRASGFADDFDREITWAYVALQANAGAIGRDPAGFAVSYDAWRKDARAPQIVRGVYLVDTGHPETLEAYRPDARMFVPVGWPDALAPVRDELAASSILSRRGTTETVIKVTREPIVASVPALVVSLPTIEMLNGRAVDNSMRLHLSSDVLVVWLDRDFLQTTFLPSLANRYFPEGDVDRYRYAIVDARDRSRRIFARPEQGSALIDPRQADATIGVFSLRFDLANLSIGTTQRTAVFRGPVPPPESGRRDSAELPTTGSGTTGSGTTISGGRRFSVYVEQVTTRGRREGGAPAGARTDGIVATDVRFGAPTAWLLLLQHPAGSLDAAVNQVRRRNLAVSFGVLALLGVSVCLVVMNAQRSQRLAERQMDFVTTVSHELRTPVAVIRSAAQNLSAGVVQDGAQTKRYGDLIDSEGRRLMDMVEEVLDYASLSGGRRPPRASPTDAARLIRDVVESSEALLHAGGIESAVDVADDLPTVAVDERALRRALQNLVTNAVKHGGDGRWIGISARRVAARGRDEVHITVSDRGRGIDPADLPHLFEPFYRGQDALRQQTSGSGLGLSLVQRIAEAHGGRVTVTSTVGQGASFTVALLTSKGSEVFSTRTAASGPEVPTIPAKSTSGT